MSRLHRTREQWRALIAEFEQSNLSQKDFCEPRGINPTYFSQRRSELQRDAEDNDTGFALVVPAKVQVIRHVRPKYSCRTCEQQGTESNIKQAPVVPSMLPKSIATPSLLGQIITAKFQYGLPLYRQEAMFKQFGADISRQTMSR